MKENNGITLVALIITVIILLILAGITIESLTQNGLFKKAQQAENNILISQKQENDILKDYETQINELNNNSTESERNKMYLYNQGNEYLDITGGWNVGFINGTDSSVGSIKKYEKYIEIKTWGYWIGLGMTSVNNINFADYSKLCVEIYDTSWTDISGGYEQIAILCDDVTQDIIYTNDIQDKIYEEDISQMNDSYIITIMGGNGANAKIKSVWLEK